uniref:Uncharacterized protein n=1 Tax=Melanopsichium pennsylvanicum 4 TaxID=1398559 RepID=A0A077QXH2_9BASI|nr:uncharacterized protein BN887_06010 [Melanopsichium pennsylvanicum 4]
MDGNRAPALEEEHINWIKSKFDEKSDLRIADLHNDIQKACDIKPKLSNEIYKNTKNLLEAIRTSANIVISGLVTSWIRDVNRNLVRSVNGKILESE